MSTHSRSVPLDRALSACQWAVLVRRDGPHEDYTFRTAVRRGPMSTMQTVVFDEERPADELARALVRSFQGYGTSGVAVHGARGEPALLVPPERRQEDPRTLGPHAVRARMGQGRLGSLYLLEDESVVRVLSPEVGPVALRSRLPGLVARGRLLLLPVECTAEERCAMEEGLQLQVCLQELLERFPTLPVGWALSIFVRLLANLAASHEQGIIHGGLSTDRIFLFLSFGSVGVKVIEAGVDHRLSGREGAAATPRDDLRAAGRILCEMLRGPPAAADAPPPRTPGSSAPGPESLWEVGLRLQGAECDASAMTVLRRVAEEVTIEQPFEHTIPMHPFVVEKVLRGDASRSRAGDRVECLSAVRLGVLDACLREASSGVSMSILQFGVDAKEPALEDPQLILLLSGWDPIHEKFVISHFLSHELEAQVTAPEPEVKKPARGSVRTALGLLALAFAPLPGLSLGARLVDATLLVVTAGVAVTGLCLALGVSLLSRRT